MWKTKNRLFYWGGVILCRIYGYLFRDDDESSHFHEDSETNEQSENRDDSLLSTSDFWVIPIKNIYLTFNLNF